MGFRHLVSSMKHWKFLLVILALCSSKLALAQSVDPADAQRLEQQGKLAEAAQAWRAITRQNPNDAAAFASLGAVLSKQQKYAEAASVYRQALAFDPKLPGVQLNLGLAEFKQGHFNEAIAPLKAALASQPSSTQSRTLLGISCYGAKKFAEAVKYLEEQRSIPKGPRRAGSSAGSSRNRRTSPAASRIE